MEPVGGGRTAGVRTGASAMTEAHADPAPLAHPDHDAVAAELRSWYTTSTPEAGIEVTEHPFGYLSNADHPDPTRLLLTVDDPEEVPGALAEAAGLHGAAALTVVVDDRARASRLARALRSSGCTLVKAVTNLANVGEFPEVSGPSDLELVAVDEGALEAWCVVKLRCFDPDDAVPSDLELARELEVRRRELPVSSVWTVRVAGEPVGVLAYYPGNDQLTYNLGTLRSYRHLGIARSALAWWVRRGRADGARSLLINCDDPGRPQELYRSLGFTDEVYWTQRWAWRRVAG